MALALHAWMLTLLPVAPAPSAALRRGGGGALSVRAIMLPPPDVEASLAPAPARAPRPIERRDASRGAEAIVAASPAAAPQIPPATIPAEERVQTEQSFADDAITVPVYRTQLPPSQTLQFEVRRGGVVGEARLAWRVGDGRYDLQLQGSGGAALTPQWRSQGLLDEAGIAPERFAVSRRGRERHAANFQRESQRISFSGPATVWPLVRGAQDRLSWMLQLAAVLQAEPALAQPGARISMFVVGAHGDADIWTFVVQGDDESYAAVAGIAARSVHLKSEAAGAYAPEVQLWLDPARHFLPLRMQLISRRGGESTDWRLVALQDP